MASLHHGKSRWNHYIITLYYLSSFLHCPFLSMWPYKVMYLTRKWSLSWYDPKGSKRTLGEWRVLPKYDCWWTNTSITFCREVTVCWSRTDDRTAGKSEPLLFLRSVSRLARVVLERRLWRVSRLWRWSRAYCLLYLLGAVMDTLAGHLNWGQAMTPRESGNLWILARIAEHHKCNAVMEHKGQTNASPSGNGKRDDMWPSFNDLQDF